jgi:hypothetical protein
VTGRARTRRRLSRTFSQQRFGEYRELLLQAQQQGYTIRALEEWIIEPDRSKPPVMILRHDVDQHPRSVRPMLAAERELGLTSTWYFRWRTASPRIVQEVRDAGSDVGLHYETLSRLAIAAGRTEVDDALVDEARGILKAEIATFADRFGPIRSVCPHGDTRVPKVRNAVLLEGRDTREYGVEFDGNFAVRHRPLGCWLTDRSSAEGNWKDGLDAPALVAARVSPILCLTHPNNWASGPSLWFDRLLGAAVPGRGRWPIRTVSDEPPAPLSAPAATARTAPAETAPPAR